MQVDPEILKNFEGNYLGVTNGYVSVTREANSLVMEWDGEKVLLEAVRNDLFVGQYNRRKISVGFRVLDSDGRYAIINGSPCKITEIERTAPAENGRIMKVSSILVFLLQNLCFTLANMD
ncbi:hypothetical protein [Terribacillus saccharophilus]|uniref:hypothetical protein n=1 Tax=Terribacillus saccharophilus TaxID=361277 RepID=UPI001595E919|nr:hypothetical protein [Terribacillus saccharophilus]